jgi:diphthine-ammonia ligase
MEYAFASWSGGKDSCLACYRAVTSGIKVRYLFNMISEDGLRSRSHGIATRWLQMQAEAMGIKLIQQPTKDDEYETNFKKAVLALKQDGITEGVFGDIDFNAHREWIDRVCSDVGVTAHLPLWEENQNKLFREFVDLGFEAVVVTTKADVLGEEWLGRKLDADFLAELARIENITPCGEAGEYHTLVIDGPLFKKRLEIVEASKVRREGYWFLEVRKCELTAPGKGQ